jgi:hypothetical protein
MKSILLLIILLSITVSNIANNNDDKIIKILQTLRVSQEKINSNSNDTFCYHGPSGSKQAYLSNKWKNYVGSHETLVYPFCLITAELGNKLGNYFNEIACAERSGLHFMSIHKQWDLTGSHHDKTIIDSEKKQIKLNDDNKHKLAFLHALPELIIHDSPLPENEARDMIQKECKCNRYCWQDRDAPWVKTIPSISKYLISAISSYLETIDTKQGTLIAPDTDITNAKPGAILPLIPDVAIQYRCGDNIGFSYMYGVLPFYAFLPRIPNNTELIYVLSDHPSRAVHSPYSSRCQTILNGLFEYLTEKFPKSTIVIKRGGDLFLDYARLSLAKTTICSASSYCLWPALANNGTVHFPLSSLVAGADSLELVSFLEIFFK